jgi:dynactin complex subunit
VISFSGRASKLEVENQILKEAARKRAERIEELERELAKIGRAGYRERSAELEQHNQQLVEAATKYALRIQELENEFTRISKLLCKSGDDPTSGS